MSSTAGAAGTNGDDDDDNADDNDDGDDDNDAGPLPARGSPQVLAGEAVRDHHSTLGGAARRPKVNDQITT